MPRYSGGQLFIAKAVAVALTAVIVGSQVAESRRELVPSILVVLAGLGALVAVYEAVSHSIALLLGRVWARNRPSEEASAPGSASVTSSPALKSRMRLRHITAAFVGYLAGQALVWLGAVIVVTVRLGAGADEEAITGGIKPLLPVVLPVSVVAGGLGALWAIRIWGKRLDPRDFVETVALRLGSRGQLQRGILAGATLGLVSLLIMPYVPYTPSSPDLIDEFLAAPGPARWSWILSAVILAPPVEELVFRGVLLGGLAQIWNLRAAAVVSGVTFWAMHAPEWLRYWPAAVAIALMTVIVTVLRIRSRALGPPIAAHSAYNLLMASVVFYGIQPDGSLPGSDRPKWGQVVSPPASPPSVAEGRLKLDMDLGLRGKRGLVTGSTAGIGLATARALAAEGAQADLSGAAGCKELVRQLAGVDILVNNLGIFDPKPFEEISDADWFRFFETNVLSGVRLSRHYIPGMRDRNWGRVVFVSSESAVQIPAEMIHYGMTKTAQLATARPLIYSAAVRDSR